MTFQEACAEVANMAQHQDRVIYLYKDNDEGCWLASHNHWGDWLFKAYPGGRKEMSVRGNEVLQLKTPPNTRLHADGANEPEHTGIPETCKHPECVRLFQSPAGKA